MATFEDLRTRAAVRFRDPDNKIVSDDSWGDYINEAYARVLGATPLWPWNVESRTIFTYAASANTHALLTDSWVVRNVFNLTDQIVMKQEQGWSSYLTRWPLTTQSLGTPSEWQVYGQALEIFPYPARQTCVQIDYMKIPALLSADGDLPVFPPSYHHVLVEMALGQAYQDDGEFDQAQAHEARAQAIIKEMMIHLLQSSGNHYPQIVDNWFGDR